MPAVADWVHRRLIYTSGASRPVDTAVDTLLAGQGVCRDYAHLTITLLRALEIPARLVAVYAPGLAPMDFHAVVEADIDGTWSVVDATRLAPTSSLVAHLLRPGRRRHRLPVAVRRRRPVPGHDRHGDDGGSPAGSGRRTVPAPLIDFRSPHGICGLLRDRRSR